MSAKEYWDTMNATDRLANFPDFDPAVFGARWDSLTRAQQRVIYFCKEAFFPSHEFKTEYQGRFI